MHHKQLRLLIQLIKMDWINRYQGSYVGFLWAFLTPLFSLLVYTLVFGVFLQAKWSSGTQSTVDFALWLFVGIVVHGLFAEVLTRSPQLIIQNSNYVTKVIFPLTIIPLSNVLSALIFALVSVFVLLLALWIRLENTPWTFIYLPLVWLPFIVLLTGVSWGLAALGVYIRDINQMVAPFSMLLLFLSPVFYPLSQVPLEWQWLFQWNPLTLIIEQTRAVLIFSQLPDWQALSLYMLVSLLVCLMGWWSFNKLKKGFADVL